MRISRIIANLKTMSDVEKIFFYNSLSEQEKKNEEIVTIVAPLDYSIINNLENSFKISMMIISLKDGNIFHALDDVFKKNKTIQDVALKYSVDIYEYIKSEDDSFNKNLNFVKINSLVLKKLPKDYQEDYEFIVEALRLNLKVWNILDENVKNDLINDQEFMEELVSLDGYFFFNIQHKYPEVREMIKDCLSSITLDSTSIFDHLTQTEYSEMMEVKNIITENVKNDQFFIYSLIEAGILNHNYIADVFSNDLELLKYAVETDFSTYASLSDELKINESLLKIFISKEGSDLRMIPKKYFDSLEKVREVLVIIEKNKEDLILLNEIISIDLLKENQNISKFISSNIEIGKYNNDYINIDNLLSYIEKCIMVQDIVPASINVKKRKF